MRSPLPDSKKLPELPARKGGPSITYGSQPSQKYQEDYGIVRIIGLDTLSKINREVYIPIYLFWKQYSSYLQHELALEKKPMVIDRYGYDIYNEFGPSAYERSRVPAVLYIK